MNQTAKNLWDRYNQALHKAMPLMLRKKSTPWTPAECSLASDVMLLGARLVLLLLNIIAPDWFDKKLPDEDKEPTPPIDPEEKFDLLQDLIDDVCRVNLETMTKRVEEAIERFIAACGFEPDSPTGHSIRNTILAKYLRCLAKGGATEGWETIRYWLREETSRRFVAGLAPKLTAINPDGPKLLRQLLSKPDPREQLRL